MAFRVRNYLASKNLSPDEITRTAPLHFREREDFPRPGGRCWARDCIGYALPEGLEPRTPLTVIFWDRFQGVARDENGEEWSLCRTQISTRYSVTVKGWTYYEPGSVFVAHVRSALWDAEEKLRADRWRHVGQKQETEEAADWLRWILERGKEPVRKT